MIELAAILCWAAALTYAARSCSGPLRERLSSVLPAGPSGGVRDLGARGFAHVGDWLQKRARAHSLKALGLALERAGLPRREAPRVLATQLLAGVAALIPASALAALGLPLALPVTLPAAAFLWPRLKLHARIRRRQREIFLGFPYYLDLLTLALEAGMDLVAAVEEIVVRDSPNALREELLLTLKSIRMGTPRALAFRQLADRSGVEALGLWASSISQSEQLGAGLGNLLRLQAQGLRQEIFRQAEERAQKAPVKMLLPLIGLIFPVVFVLLFAPIAMRMF